MNGILAYGAYVPFNRLKRSTIGEALQLRAGKGERAVASYDEDTVTMAVEAARNCLRNGEADHVQALTFATTEPPYQENLNAATVHAALDLPLAVRAIDVMGSTRAGLAAVVNGLRSHDRCLVAMSDIRIGAPEGAAEQSGGDGASALLLGQGDTIAEVEAMHSETLVHQALWRLPGEPFAKTWEERFALESVYVPLLRQGLHALIAESGVAPENWNHLILDAPNSRAAAMVAKTFNLGPEVVADPLLESLGHTGTAHAGLRLAQTLDIAKPGDRIAVLSVSDGMDAVLLRVTEHIDKHRAVRSVQDCINAKRNDLAYARYLKWRGILPTERPRRPDPDRPAGPPVFRRRHWKYALNGSECAACGTRHVPPQTVCVKCGAQGQMKELSFANRTARIATFTLDRIAYTPQPPMVSAMVDFEGGGRMEIEVTDCEPETIAIGDEVEMTFRRLFTADGVHNYFWKARPVRKTG